MENNQLQQIGLISDNYSQLSIEYDKSNEILWTALRQNNRIPSFNAELINEVTRHQQEIELSGGVICIGEEIHAIKYAVASSQTPNVFNLGGHLPLIRELAMNRQIDALRAYAMNGVNALAHRLNRFNLPNIITISLLQGQTIGAGLEVALTSDVIIAEKKTILGFPEIMFNSFPGMGGYSLTARKAGTAIADKMLLNGQLYTGEQAYELGLVDVLVGDGEGVNAVLKWVAENKRIATGYLAIQKAKARYNPVTYAELIDITEIWLDNILKLSERDFGIMDRFIRHQAKQYLPAVVAPDTMQSNVVMLKQAT